MKPTFAAFSTALVSLPILATGIEAELEQQTAWSPDPGPPPAAIYDALLRSPRPTVEFEDYAGTIYIDVDAARIRILWEERVSDAFLIQNIQFAYWPTNIAATRDGEGFYVAGKRRSNGNTVIELYELESPSTVVDITTGARVIIPANVSSIDSLYDDAVEGRDYVKCMAVRRSGAHGVLAQFFDSRDVYSSSSVAGQGALTRVATPDTTATGVLTSSELGGVITHAWSDTHVTRGDVYVFGPFGLNEMPSYNFVVLQDGDKDGTLDSTEVISAGSWEASDMSSASNYQ